MNLTKAVQKINLAMHPDYVALLLRIRHRTGQPLGQIVEEALQHTHKIRLKPGTRRKRGRKPGIVKKGS